MFNKTDMAKSSETQNRGSRISEKKITDSKVQLTAISPTAKDTESSFSNRVITKFKRLSLSTKATILAIAIGTLPVLGIGTLAYTLATKSVNDKTSGQQQVDATSLADKANRFMFERYGDIQVLANLPILINSRVREVTTPKEKQALLDKFIETYKVYDSVAVFDLNGNAILQTQGDSSGNQSSSPYFQEVRQKNLPYIGKPEASPNSNVKTIKFAAPVKDSRTGETIAIVRTSMPVKYLEDVLKSSIQSGQQYDLVNDSGKILLSQQTNQIGKDAKTSFPNLANVQGIKKEDTWIADNQLVSYAAKTLEGLPDLKWGVILATDGNTAFATQRELLLTIALGTGLTALLVAFIAAWLAKRATEPILNATEAVGKLGQGELNTRLYIEGEDELSVLSANINFMAEQLQALLKEQELDTERAKLLADITLRIRRNLKTEDIYKTAVREVRQGLKTDRVVVYILDQETWEGNVVAESVNAGLPKMMGVEIDDPCFRERHVQTYKDGRVRAINNIYQDLSISNAACYIKMLEKFAVKANLVAPIVIREQLVGLLIAHECDNPRAWQQVEIDSFKQVATQIGYALEQAKLLEQIENAKDTAESSSQEERRQKEDLQLQLLELLSEVEGAASGDLTVRADVTAGEIGTVADFFNSIVESLRSIVTQVKDTAVRVNQGIGSNSIAIRELAEEALAQTSEINRTLNAVDEMTFSMQAVALNAQQAAIVAQTASRTATKSGEAMDLTVQNILHLRETVGETAKKVKRLGESTQQISRVVALINQIAMQTNLLAINAGIEAARAGEEGQGFAVVAEEVGELAARSAAATKEIEQVVENIQRETNEVVQAMEVGTTQVVEGTRIVEDAKHSLGQILEVSRQIDYLVQSISTATANQVQTSETVSALMKQIAANSERTSTSSRQVSESLEQTVEISQKLQETVGTFKVN